MGRPGRRSIHRRRYHSDRTDLADSLKRFLLITRRRIPLDRADEYQRLWHHVHHAAGLNGARAWVFMGTHASDRFIEFIEWQSDRENFIIVRDLQLALETLNTTFQPEEMDTWVETKI